MALPNISVVIPVLNADSVLEKCLHSISIQDYPKEKIEIIIADGGSTDKTLEIAKKFKAKIINNPLKTGESGKAIGVKKATGDLVALIDSDNILPSKTWLKKMVKPFTDKTIIASEPIKYTYRKKDSYLTRYFASLGMNDPICLFTGNYDRLCVLTGKWTGLNFKQVNKGEYIKVILDHEPIPTIGANGFIIQRSTLSQAKVGDYLFDIDVLINLIRKKGQVNIAKVKVGIVHTFVEDSQTKFFRKQLRRIKDMSFHKSKNSRAINWEGSYLAEIIWFQVQCLLVFPILYQTLKGLLKTKDTAWLFHPVACYSTWLIYLYGWTEGKINPSESSRHKWRQ
ncbi:glycosyltransferase family 2 protein [Patescibacteria group bacterium]|nr:glycosyltransferase family 2 protein [Patescibacteria group bacterium]MBU1256202.1 glycosyltransferase family 2 protein [Patescibacteria group bacterium]